VSANASHSSLNERKTHIMAGSVFRGGITRKSRIASDISIGVSILFRIGSV
jgi:hypothetical protein